VRESNTHERARAPVWQLLESVREHEQIGQWLAESDAKQELAPRRSKLHLWKIAASIGLVFCIAVPLMYHHFGSQRFSTGIGEQRDLLLADGSRISMNTDTSLSVRYSKDSRRIELEHGEAFFTVKHDQSRPFDVVAGQTLTRAVGTEFNVDLRQSQVTVTVVDGIVRVSASPEDVPGAGRRLCKSATGHEQRAKTVAMSGALMHGGPGGSNLVIHRCRKQYENSIDIRRFP
jgi:ferric-dicitrate binding protein FerR (iron transport regulator)